MMKVILQVVLLVGMAGALSAQAVPAVHPVSNPTIELMSVSYGPQGLSTLDVRQLAAPDARLKYVEIGDLLPQKTATTEEATTADMPPASSADGSVGMTSFDGSSIVVPAAVESSAQPSEPVRIGTVSGVNGGQSPAANASVCQGSRIVNTADWAPLGGRPVVQKLMRVEYRVQGGSVVKRSSVTVQGSRAASIQRTGGGSFGSHK